MRIKRLSSVVPGGTKALPFCLFCLLLLLTGCQQKQAGQCRIHGRVVGEQYEGKRIFLVPLFGPKTAEYVDSVEVTDGKFEFCRDTMQMYKILMDYHYRLGVQQLIVVGEPGDIQVVIDSVSHAYGTPQNDSLEKWKVRTEQHNVQLAKMRRYAEELKRQGDESQAEYIKERADSFHLVYKNYTRRLARSLEGQTLGNFLKDLYPLTYKRKFPDGRVVTMDADTNEEISE